MFPLMWYFSFLTTSPWEKDFCISFGVLALVLGTVGGVIKSYLSYNRKWTSSYRFQFCHLSFIPGKSLYFCVYSMTYPLTSLIICQVDEIPTRPLWLLNLNFKPRPAVCTLGCNLYLDVLQYGKFTMFNFPQPSNTTKTQLSHLPSVSGNR